MAQLTLNSLADELLTAVLGHLSFEERLEAAEVCRRWRRLVNTARELLPRSVAVAFGGTQEHGARLDSFCAWLQMYGAGHVQQLDIAVEIVLPPNRGFARMSVPAGNPPTEWWRAAQPAERAAAVAACVAACGAAGGLQALRLEGVVPRSALWAGSLRSLRRLVLVTLHRLTWDAPPQALPALEELALEGLPLARLRAALPPSLTKLHLSMSDEHGYEDEYSDDEPNVCSSLPDEVADLPRLHTLILNHVEAHEEDACDTLASMPALRRLELLDCRALPSCLSQLTCLEALVVDNSGCELNADGDAADVVAAALPQLARLTSLAVGPMPGAPHPPAQLAALTSLHTLFWLGHEGGALPAGAWMARLRRLAASADMVAGSGAALAADAAGLEFLGVAFAAQGGAHLPAVLELPARLPSLKHLLLAGLEWVQGDEGPSLAAVEQLRPDVDVRAVELEFGGYVHTFLPLCGFDRAHMQSL